MSSLTLDFVLETDYDGLLAFCEQQHCAETLKFWSGESPPDRAPELTPPRRRGGL